MKKSEYRHMQSEKAKMRWEKAPKDPKQEVLAAYSEGLGFEGITDILLQCDDNPCEKDDFYRAQNEIIPILEDLAQKSCENAFNEMPNGGFSHDGTFSARRKAEYCLVEMISSKTHKIFGYSIASLDPEVSFFPIPEGTKSNQLESLALKNLWEKIKDKHDVSKLEYRIHDRDVNSFAIFDDVEDVLPDFDDPNHSYATFEQKVKQLQIDYPIGKLSDSILQRFKALTHYKNMTYEKISELWLDTPNEILKHNKDQHCPLIHGIKELSPQQVQKNLDVILQNTLDFVHKCSKGSTSINEAFNSKKSRVAPKHVRYGKSFRGRVALAVLMWNEPKNWYDIITKACHIRPISHSTYIRLHEKLEQRIKHNKKEETDSSIIIRAKKKKEYEKQTKPDPDGHGTLSKPSATHPKDLIDKNRNKGIHTYGIFPHIGKADFGTSVIQMLYHTNLPSYLHLFLQEEVQTHFVLSDLYDAFQILQNEDAVRPELLYRLVYSFGYKTDVRTMPIEFYRRVMDILHRDFMQNPGVLAKFNADFRCIIQEETHCPLCKTITIKEMELYALCTQFYQTGMTTLDQIIAEYQTPSNVVSFCSSCSQWVEATIRLTIVHLPNMPVIGTFYIDPDSINNADPVDFSECRFKTMNGNEESRYLSHYIDFRGNRLNDLSGRFRLFVQEHIGSPLIEVVDGRSYERDDEQIEGKSSTACLIMMRQFEEKLEETKKYDIINSEKLLPYEKYQKMHLQDKKAKSEIMFAIIELLILVDHPLRTDEILSTIQKSNFRVNKLLTHLSKHYLPTTMSRLGEDDIHELVFTKYTKKECRFHSKTIFFGLNGKEYSPDWVPVELN